MQSESIEGLGAELGVPMAPKLERLVHALEWLRTEDLLFMAWGWGARCERFALANAFVARVAPGLQTTRWR